LFHLSCLSLESGKSLTMLALFSLLLVLFTDLAKAIDANQRPLLDLFDRPVPKPIGFIGGEPLWSRVYERADGTASVVFDDDNTAYLMNSRSFPRRSLRLNGDLKRVTAMDENNKMGREERFSVRNLRRKLNSA
ncbi:hypothetical protein PRIPAC_78691, partial [Pristionchus pacificus]